MSDQAMNLYWWEKARDVFQDELEDRQTFNRQYADLQEFGDSVDYRPALDYWKPYLFDAINKHLGESYALENYSDNELKVIVSQLEEAIHKYSDGKHYKS